MQLRTPRLPVKWFFAAAIGALFLAILLMIVFEVRAAEDPNLISSNKTSSGSPAAQMDMPALSTPSSATIPPVPPPAANPPKRPLPPKGPSLWSMLVSPAMVYGASGIAVLGLIAGLVSALRGQRRVLP